MTPRPAMPGPAVSTIPAAQDRISLEEMTALVRRRRRDRLRMRRDLREHGMMSDGLVDREQAVWLAIEQLLARCLSRRMEVVDLLRVVAVDRIDQESEDV